MLVIRQCLRQISIWDLEDGTPIVGDQLLGSKVAAPLRSVGPLIRGQELPGVTVHQMVAKVEWMVND